MYRRVYEIGGVVACALLGGCAGGGVGFATPATGAATVAEGSEGGNLSAQACSIDVPREARFEPWGDAAGSLKHSLVIERTGPAPGETRWSVRRLEQRGEAPKVVNELFMVLIDGGVAIERQIDHDERVDVWFDPPLVVMPESMEAGVAPLEQRVRMVVRPLGKPDRIRAQGEAVSVLEYGGEQVVSVPGREAGVASRLVRSTLRADLSPSSVVNVTEQWFADGVGLIAERRHERTSVLGVTVRDNREGFIRVME
jgi:hypothetical protein